MVGDFNRLYIAAIALPILAGAITAPALADPVARSAPAAGAVIARKAGEEVRFIDLSNWQVIDLKQDLLTGDILRTNATGQLAIVFSDRTQVRLGRNSSLVVKQMTAGTSADTILELQSGTIWARAERGGPGVRVETPAAAAAIRGTDWTMTVKGSQTSLQVLEGLVELSNPQGSVDVQQGEGAVASIGQAPRKIVIVESDDREQMLYYLAPRNAFSFMPASPLPVAEMRRQADRIAAIPASRRKTEDILTLAEVQTSLEGHAQAQATLALLNGRTLSSAERGRLELMKGIFAAAERRYDEAAKLFVSASPRLDAKRGNVAAYGSYYARSLAKPDRVERPPTAVNSSYAALLKAYAAGFLEDIPAAIKVIRDAERQFPNDPTLPAYRSQLAILLNDRAQVQEAIGRSLAIDPAEPTALEARANYRADFEGDLEGALADIQAALKTAPGSTGFWNALGNIQSARGDDRSAEAAFKKSIALDPHDPVAYSNLANHYLSQYRVEEAKALINKALEVDPSFDLALVDRGRYHLQTGNLDAGLEDMLGGTVANPAYSAGQTMLAAAHYEKGDRIAAGQALDNADRLDNNSPAVSAFRTALAIDSYDSEGAIRHAQDYVKRSRARGGYYKSLGANQAAGSTLNDAFRFQGMNSWAEYYSDAVFDPFAGTAYLDQSIRGSADIFANDYSPGTDIFNNSANGQSFSGFLQGLMLEPHMISGRSRSANFFRRPFFETSLGGGVTDTSGELGYVAEGEVRGYSNLPFPISFYGNLKWETVPESRDVVALSDLVTENKVLGGNGYLTANPTPYDRIVLYFNDAKADFSRDVQIEAPPILYGIPLAGIAPLTTERDVSSRVTNGGLGWSHTFGYRNVLNAGLLYSGLNNEDQEYLEFDFGLPFPVVRQTDEFSQKTYIAAINHAVGSGNLTWRYGLEGGWIDTRQMQTAEDLRPPFLGGGTVTTSDISERSTIGRVYVDLLHEISQDLKAEYSLFGSYVESDSTDIARLEPRLGLAWSPADGQWLRAGFMRSSIDISTPTLSPIGIVGLQPNQVSVGTEGYVDTYALRWDAEWTPDFFTAVEFQHQDLDDPRISIPLVATPFAISEGRIDRASASANLLLGHGFGLSSTLAYTASEDEDPASATFGNSLPYIPEWAGQVALTWVNEANVKATIAANYVGQRVNEGGTDLDDYWTLDANLVWEPFDKLFELELAAFNLLDEEIELNAGLPGWGRVFKGTLKVRF
jgi:tetratricopeptide (TPR) repeat protein